MILLCQLGEFKYKNIFCLDILSEIIVLVRINNRKLLFINTFVS
jgi:hypothetical protein